MSCIFHACEVEIADASPSPSPSSFPLIEPCSFRFGLAFSCSSASPTADASASFPLISVICINCPSILLRAMLPKMIGDSIVILFATVFLSFHFAVSLFFYMTFNGFSLDLKNVKRKLFLLYVYSEKCRQISNTMAQSHSLSLHNPVQLLTVFPLTFPTNCQFSNPPTVWQPLAQY